MAKNENKSHLFLLNPTGESKRFDATRGYKPNTINQKPANVYRAQKVILGDSLNHFRRKRAEREEQRTIEVPARLELITVHFFVVFNDNDRYKNRARFLRDFGLLPLAYTNFNQSVLFTIVDQAKFLIFIKCLEDFINSSDKQHPSGTSYSIMTIIKNFAFIGSQEILENKIDGDVVVSMIFPNNGIIKEFEVILHSLRNHLAKAKQDKEIGEFNISENIIQIKSAPEGFIEGLAANYDIIHKIHSLRVPTLKENLYNQPEISWDFQILPPQDKSVLIGVLDNGIRAIAPIQDIILDYGLDITSDSPNALSTNSPHGTVVSLLAAIGLDYFNSQKKQFRADAWIVPIKILNFSTGYFNPFDIEEVIKKAYKRGVKIFNLSVCGPSKMYNSTISEYAYLLDKLAYKYDLLIFIATGNLDFDDIEEMSNDDNPLHRYPNHFYNPFKSSHHHNCECTNLCIPSESLNNVSVGAIADNMNDQEGSHLTPFKELPAYYTRKHHIDYLQKVNGTEFSDSQKNYNINKPDIIMPGGDLLNEASGMHVVGFGLNGNDFYYKDAGTSLATPIATNLSAKILRMYPHLSMQSIKALILNSSSRPLNGEFLDSLIDEIKNEYSNNKYGMDFALINDQERKSINSLIKSEEIYRRLVGSGLPDYQKALYSNSKSVTLIVQDSITVDSFKVININIPDYLRKYKRPSYILQLKATLCFKFFPVFNNHLGYNPLHISFNFIKSAEKDNPARTSEIISNKKDEYFEQFYQPGFSDEDKLKAKRKAIGIKSTIQSWSEDFYPKSNKPFSNVQTLEIKLTASEIEKVDGQISLVVRSTCKTDHDKNIVDWLKATAHDFSIALSISEKNNDELNDYSLYDELEKHNKLKQVMTLDIDVESDIDLEADL